MTIGKYSNHDNLQYAIPPASIHKKGLWANSRIGTRISSYLSYLENTIIEKPEVIDRIEMTNSRIGTMPEHEERIECQSIDPSIYQSILSNSRILQMIMAANQQPMYVIRNLVSSIPTFSLQLMIVAHSCMK